MEARKAGNYGSGIVDIGVVGKRKGGGFGEELWLVGGRDAW